MWCNNNFINSNYLIKLLLVLMVYYNYGNNVYRIIPNSADMSILTLSSHDIGLMSLLGLVIYLLPNMYCISQLMHCLNTLAN